MILLILLRTLSHNKKLFVTFVVNDVGISSAHPTMPSIDGDVVMVMLSRRVESQGAASVTPIKEVR